MSIIKRKPAEKPKPLSARIKEAAQLAELEEIERAAAIKREEELAAARFEKEKADRERDKVRAEWTSQDRTERKQFDAERYRAVLNKAVPYLPLVLVNIAAVIGQVGWALDHLAIGDAGSPLRWFAAIMFGSTAESIALFLQYYAARALMNRDSAASLYLGTFLVAGLVAAVNYSHWSNPAEGQFFGTVNATAVIFALCSFISPWLWRIHNRAEYREKLKAAGEIDTRAVKLSMARKVMYPIRSFRTIRLAAWYGETNPAKAVEMYENQRIARATVKAAKQAEKAQAKAAKQAEKDAKKIEKAPESPEPAESPEPVTAAPERPAPAANGSRDWTRHSRWNEAVGVAQSIKDSGEKLTVAKVCDQLGIKNKALPGAVVRYVNGEGNGSTNGHGPAVSDPA
jgi:chemotaxis protein histidine kinase CheA